MSHLSTLVNRFLRAINSQRRNHYVANIIEYLWYNRDKAYVSDREVEDLVRILEEQA